MRALEILSSTFFFSTLAQADVEFLSPLAGSTAKGGDVLTAIWMDSGNPPKIAELTNYSLSLCAGGDNPESIVSMELHSLPCMECYIRMRRLIFNSQSV